MTMVIDLLMSTYQAGLFVYTLKKQFVQRPHSFGFEVGCVLLMVAYLTMLQYLRLPISENLTFLFPLVYIKLTTDERLLTCALWTTLDAFLMMGTLTLVSSLFDIQIAMNGSVIYAADEASALYSFVGNAAITVVMNIAARINKVKSIVSRKEMLIFLAMLLLCFGVNECVFVARVVPQNDQVLWIGSACAFAVMILVMILYERMTDTVQKQKKSEMEAQAAQLLNKQQDELKSIYKNMLAEQHDLRHRVAAAEEILTAATVDDGQRSSILQLLQSDAQTRLFITGSVAVDAILKAKSTVMENAGITFEFVEYPLMPLPISEQNFCMLLGNLLDNAIEGVMRLPASAPSRCIRLSFSKVWNMLFITCTNDADGSTIKRHGDEFISTKEHPELHGFGMKNMKKIVDAADGTLEYKIGQNRFTVEIMLGGAIPC